jgi:two-component system, NarL family, response regulator YdfI
MTRGVRAPTPVFVVAESAVAAARVEAILRGDPAVRAVVLDAGALAALEAERDAAIVILSASAPAAGRMLGTLGSLRRPPSVILLTPAPHEAWTARARRTGVRAVLGRDATAEEVSAAVAATKAGLLVLHPDALSSVAATELTPGEPATLTVREVEILEMMAEGMSNRAIAARLKISRNTVKFHVASILSKLAARSRTEAVTVGVRHGLISL